MNRRTNGFIFVDEPDLLSGYIVEDTSKLPKGTHANMVSWNGTKVTFVGWGLLSSLTQYYTQFNVEKVT